MPQGRAVRPEAVQRPQELRGTPGLGAALGLVSADAASRMGRKAVGIMEMVVMSGVMMQV